MYVDVVHPSKEGYVRKLIRKVCCVHPSKEGYVRKVD